MADELVVRVQSHGYVLFVLQMRTFDEDITSWDVSSVTNMERMFYKAIKFNGNVSQWDVSSVTNIECFLKQHSMGTCLGGM